MPTTQIDYLEIGIIFQQSALAISKRIHDNIFDLSQDQIQELSNRSQELFAKSKVMFTMEVLDIADNIKPLLDNLKQAKDNISNAITKIEEVQDVIDFSVKLVSLASAIISGNVASIIPSIQDVLSISAAAA